MKEIVSNWKSNSLGIVKVIIGIVILIFIFKYLPKIINTNRLKTFDKEVVGEFISLKENTKPDLGFEPNEIVVVSTEINYLFYVDDEPYISSKTLDRSVIDLKKLGDIKNGEMDLIVRYDSKNPERNIIKLY